MALSAACHVAGATHHLTELAPQQIVVIKARRQFSSTVPQLEYLSMDWDDLAETESGKLFAGWLRLLLQKWPALPLELAGRHRRGVHATEASRFTTGAYNMCCTVKFEDGFRVLVRFPILGRSRFRTEKTDDELLVMAFLDQRLQIPIPKVLGAGQWGCGPYIVMTFIEGTSLSKCLGDLAVSLSPTVSDSRLKRAYYGMAHVMLELSKPTFPSIVALGWDSGEWKVVKRPLTLNMNELVRVGNCPPSVFTQHQFQTASEYFQELAAQQFLHLKYQRNNAVKDELDCRKKYIARCLFRKIAREMSTEPGPFRLFCDDLRPSNALASNLDLTINGYIDWEYTYVAPAEFTYAAPWWLLFKSLEDWGSDLNGFLVQYTPRLQLFLRVLRACEDRQIQEGALIESERLSDRMARSLENGLFWFCLAARKSFMFDDIYWTYLDEKYFGHLSFLDDRLPHLTQDEQNDLDGFVQAKMQQAKEKTLDKHLTFDKIVDL